MRASEIAFVCQVISLASRLQPADSVLRSQLKAQRALSREEAARLSKAVFTYYRWHGWLDLREPLAKQVEHALDLAGRFAATPDSFTDAELMNRSVPSWLKQETGVTPGYARLLQSEPKLWLRARPGQGKALAAKLGHCE